MARIREGATVRFTWNRRNFKKLLEDSLDGRMENLGRYLVRKVRQNISIPTATYGPSSPGEFPHLDSGDLKKSIFYDVRPTGKSVWKIGYKEKRLIVGTDLRYGLYHEYQTGRSFLRRTFNEELPFLRRTLWKGTKLDSVPGREV